MRALLLALLTCGLLLSGCIAVDEGTPPAPEEQPQPAPEPPALPEPIHAEELVAASLDPLNHAGLPECSTPTARCDLYAFDVNGTAFVDAVLTWLVPANDFDLYLYRGDELVDTAGDFPPEKMEDLHLDLTAGSYTFVVVGWAVVADTFTFDATFS